mmetsp:Transcript_27175/g.56940  ORF Transcript_27175/g.56940 Transcript_27175/m.56940 type:complete len:152 (-) Transcript_27175:477-932(-)
MFKVHLFQALACNDTPGITLVLSKLVSLASDHGFRSAISNTQHNNHVDRNAGHVGGNANHVKRGADHVSRSMYSMYVSILCLIHFHLLLKLQSNYCLFVSFSQKSFIIKNNVDTSAMKSIANTSFSPSVTGTPQQLQPERKPTMAKATALC